jgi:glycosyltransferase involved in cell wall biosynthesis
MNILGIEFEELKNSNQDYVLSVFCRTFNHRKYIEEALDSFLKQITDFKYEIVVVDDASDDGTTEILRAYYNKYHDLFHVFIAKNNFYPIDNKRKIINALMGQNLKGRYVAFCEGDDYWIDAYKLQCQVSYMEKHPECSLTMHNGLRKDEQKGTSEIMKPGAVSHEITLEELIIQENGIWPTASMVIRKEDLIPVDLFNECPVGDWSRQLYAATKGKVYFLHQTLSAYRYMHEGSWTFGMRDNEKRFFHNYKMIKFLNAYDEYTKYRYDKYIITKIHHFYLDSMNMYEEKFEKLCEDSEYLLYLNEVKRLKRIEKEEFDKDENLNKFLDDYKYIYIMGMGNYSQKVTKYLKQKNIKVSGYVLSNNQNINKAEGLEVFHLSELSTKKNCGVIVGINPVKWYELEDSLELNNIQNYYCPFLGTS